MHCPFCHYEDTQVKDSRPSDDGKSIRRRRECPNCGRRFTTFERFQAQQILVVKRDGKRELFEREKVLKSIMTALRKRPISQPEIEEMATQVEQKLTEIGKGELTTKEVGDVVLDALKTADFIGYIRYASVYNDFNNPDDFSKLIADL